MSELIHISFVCTGNICRSPIAEKVFAHQIRGRGLDPYVRVSSAGIGDWHTGLGADERARRVLREHGYPTQHCAAPLDDDHLSADLLVALGHNHARILAQLGVPSDRVRLLRSFDPQSGAHALDVEDPYYGQYTDFVETLVVIERSLPGLHDWVDERLGNRGLAS